MNRSLWSYSCLCSRGKSFIDDNRNHFFFHSCVSHRQLLVTSEWSLILGQSFTPPCWERVRGLLVLLGSTTVCVHVSFPHLVAVHLVTMFEAKCFAQRNCDGKAHDGYGKSIAHDTWEPRGIWSTRGLEAGEEEKKLIIWGFIGDVHLCFFYNLKTHLR